ncbi:HAD family hydrolase [Catenisphaera adipataccumulans]|jgi:putative hydrolase of the HAD superfamily|uniref:Putative hydrolase of the HAD superfamily n=1 Tax=Catenisphaera adipataccumulans TaxID=700500 RepID=A0A7W8CY10_9FIRM|nr:HAD family hydrolase [Catenisphaera adipataccumulans]MBB5183666.1 putative hydrolase of the HAD superfamily [Catenisphaera adipataccumulans]
MKFCFDCDDTLYDLQEPFLRTVRHELPNIGKIDLSAFYQCYRGYGDEVYQLLQDGIITVDDSGIYRAYKAAEEFGIPMTLEKACDFQERYGYEQHHIQLSDIYKKYFSDTNSELAILTNGEDSHQRMKLNALGVFDYFAPDHVFTSGEIGAAKPEAEAFQIVCHRMQTEPEEWFYIGDNYVNDMEGAKSAGMHTIHFNRHHAHEGPASDHVVYTEEELIRYLRKLEENESSL